MHSWSEVLSKDADHFLKISSFRYLFHIFAIADQLSSFSISRLANVEEFFNANIFLNININLSIKDYLLKYIFVVRSADFTTPNSHQRF